LSILFLVIFAFSLPDFSYLYWRLAGGPLEGLVLSTPFLLLATFPLKKLHRWQRKFIYLSLGVITYLTLMTMLRDLYALISAILVPAYWVYVSTLGFMVGGSLHAYFGPHIKHVRIPVRGLHPDLVGLKIAQISDLHVGPTIRKKYVNKVMEKTNALRPDLITLTGDIADGPVKTYREDIHPLSQLKAPLGSFYVTGNHEYYWGGNEWLNVMNNLGMVVLMNRGKILLHKNARILIGGIPDPVSRILPELENIVDVGRESDFKILLSHRPGIARKAGPLGFDLQLSGHTHGGQFFPWTLVVKFVHEFNRGLSRLGTMWIYVNMGTGSWGPFLRVGSTTEITLLELENEEGLKHETLKELST
jgi:predicted MPP superfamily phosphohydrolase